MTSSSPACNCDCSSRLAEANIKINHLLKIIDGRFFTEDLKNNKDVDSLESVLMLEITARLKAESRVKEAVATVGELRRKCDELVYEVAGMREKSLTITSHPSISNDFIQSLQDELKILKEENSSLITSLSEKDSRLLRATRCLQQLTSRLKEQKNNENVSIKNNSNDDTSLLSFRPILKLMEADPPSSQYDDINHEKRKDIVYSLDPLKSTDDNGTYFFADRDLPPYQQVYVDRTEQVIAKKGARNVSKKMQQLLMKEKVLINQLAKSASEKDHLNDELVNHTTKWRTNVVKHNSEWNSGNYNNDGSFDCENNVRYNQRQAASATSLLEDLYRKQLLFLESTGIKFKEMGIDINHVIKCAINDDITSAQDGRYDERCLERALIDAAAHVRTDLREKLFTSRNSKPIPRIDRGRQAQWNHGHGQRRSRSNVRMEDNRNVISNDTMKRGRRSASHKPIPIAHRFADPEDVQDWREPWKL